MMPEKNTKTDITESMLIAKRMICLGLFFSGKHAIKYRLEVISAFDYLI